MWWLWILAGLAAVLLLVLVSRIRVRLYFTREETNDRLFLDIRALFGLVRRRIEIPVIDYRGFWEGITLQTERHGGDNGKLLREGKHHITIEKIRRWIDLSKEVLEHTEDLGGWMRDMLRHVHCEELRWETRVGVGDAAGTAVTTGVLWALKTSLLGWAFRYVRLEVNPKITVQPQYNSSQFATEGVVGAYVRMGTMMVSGIRLLARIVRTKGGMESWRKAFRKPVSAR